MSETVETVVVGGGQSGLALSYYLTQLGRDHVVLDKAARPGDAWRSQRWDSFTLVTPNWTFRVPGAEYQGDDPHGYLSRDEVVRRFEDYVERYRLPVSYDCQVTKVEPLDGAGYEVHATQKTYRARNVVIATGFFQDGKRPEFAASIPNRVTQMHSGRYRSPSALPEGAVLVVGSGQSGMQIAEELYQAGRKVFLATSGAPRAPRRYRGKDIVEWLYLSGFFDHTLDTFPFTNGRKFVPPSVTGKDGGHSLNLHQFFRDGATLLGRVQGYEDGKLALAGNLKENLAKADASEKMMLRNVDAFIERAGIAAPTEEVEQRAEAYAAEDREWLDLEREKIGTIIWASGYRFTCDLVPMKVLDEYGMTLTRRCETQWPGLFFLGIPFVSRLKSGFLLGVGEDAERVASEIAERR